jgi:hypothetical protein
VEGAKKGRVKPGLLILPAAARESELFVGRCFLLSLLRQHDDRHRRRVTRARPGLQNTQVASRALLEPGTDFRKQFANDFLVAKTVERQAAISDAVFLRQRNQRLYDTAQFFGFSCFSIEAAMLRNMALRCELLRPSRRPDFL